MKQDAVRQDSWAARRLLRECRAATLSTAALGQPFAALVTPATTARGDILLLLSDLSEHTRHLRAEPRCALFVVGKPVDANPQTAPRVSITGLAEPIEESGWRERYLAVHPYAALYADFTDFHLWRITPAAALFVGGFARATRLGAADLLPDPGVADRVAEEAKFYLESSPAWLDQVVARAGLGGGPHLSGLDLDGMDLILDNHSTRISFSAPVSEGESLSDHLKAWIK